MFKDLFSHIRTISHKVNLPESLVKLIPSDNPQVSGYLPPAALSIPASIYDQLIQFQAERGLESVEMAVTVILSEYFGLLQTPTDTETHTTTSRLQNLEAKCTSLSETVAELQTAITNLQASSQSVDYEGTPLHQHSPLPLQGSSPTVESMKSPSVEQSESLAAGSNDLQMPQSELEQLPIKESTTKRQSGSNSSVEYSESSKLTGVSASTSDLRGCLESISCYVNRLTISRTMAA